MWSTDPIAATHACYVYDTLYGLDAAMRPQPQMAEGHTVSDDGRTWRIRLRDGLWFHDGTPVRAQDCIASLQRWAGAKPVGQLLASVVESWNAPDARIIELRLTRPFPLMLDALGAADSPAYMMPERLARIPPNTPLREAAGSGPQSFPRWRIQQRQPGGFTRRFDAYVPRAEPPQCTAGGKVAWFERIEWHVMPDPSTAALALATGEVDWWESVPPDLLVLAGGTALAS